MPIAWSRWASGAIFRRAGWRSPLCNRVRGQKLFDEIAPRFKDRGGGYTRVVKFGVRRGDAAPLSIIEFTGTSEQSESKKPRKKKVARRDGGVESQRAAAGWSHRSRRQPVRFV